MFRVIHFPSDISVYSQEHTLILENCGLHIFLHTLIFKDAISIDSVLLFRSFSTLVCVFCTSIFSTFSFLQGSVFRKTLLEGDTHPQMKEKFVYVGNQPTYVVLVRNAIFIYLNAKMYMNYNRSEK